MRREARGDRERSRAWYFTRAWGITDTLVGNGVRVGWGWCHHFTKSLVQAEVNGRKSACSYLGCCFCLADSDRNPPQGRNRLFYVLFEVPGARTQLND